MIPEKDKRKKKPKKKEEKTLEQIFLETSQDPTLEEFLGPKEGKQQSSQVNLLKEERSCF